MGIACAFRSVSDNNIEKILENPPLIWRLLEPDDPDMYLSEAAIKKPVGFMDRLMGKKNVEQPAELLDLELCDGENLESDVDKSWQGIHYCLNQTEYDAKPPMNFITTGGESVGDLEIYLGPARALKSSEILDIYDQIKNINTEQLLQNYDPEKMDKLDIYPNIWKRDGDEGFEYIAQNYEELLKFISHCVEKKLGMLIYLC